MASKVSILVSFALLALSSPVVGQNNGQALRQTGQTLMGNPPDGFAGHFEFGSAVKLSYDGCRMAVGANTRQNGAVFLYERENVLGGEWDLIWEIHGKPGEGIGDRFSLSSDGTRIAIRRYDPLLGDVEIYEYNEATHQAGLLGSPVSPCRGRSSRGKALLLAEAFPSATTLIVSCESFDKNRGMIEVFRFDEQRTSWRSLQVMEGGSQGARFGWALGFADFGTASSLAISSPNYDKHRGMVQLYEFKTDESGTWLAIQKRNFTGNEQGSLFGFSLEMDRREDFVVGAPQCSGGGTARGCVHYYRLELNETGIDWDWNQHGVVHTGQYDKDRFGVNIAIARRGARIAASSFHSNYQRGYVRLYSTRSSEKTSLIDELQGETQFELYGYSIALDGSGSLLATGAIRQKNSNGISVGSMQLFFDKPIWNPPSFSPSLPPSSIPSGVDSNAPSEFPTADPTGLPTESPTVTPSLSTDTPTIYLLTAPTENVTYTPTTSLAQTSSDITSLPSALPSIAHTTSAYFPSAIPSTAPSSAPIPTFQKYVRQMGYAVVGPSRIGNQSGFFEFGSLVKLSNKGDYMAVGAPSTTGGAVFLYAREDFYDNNSDLNYRWNLIWKLLGEAGEAIGDRLALSEDGLTIAVRRYSRRRSDVEVYRWDEATQEAYMLGSPLNVCKEGNSRGKALALGTTVGTYTSMFPDTTWLLVSCENFDSARGKIEALWFDAERGDWTTFTKIYGLVEASRFGWELSFSGTVDYSPEREHPLFRVAISSPNYDENRGMVQVLTVDEFGGWTQFGETLTGRQQGDFFGFSIDMSTRGKMGVYTSAPFLVIGSPQCNLGGIARGCVQVFTWKRRTIHSPFKWNQHGKTITGLVDNDRFGYDVSIASTGDRLAASSFHHRHQTGIIRLYDIFLEMKEVGELLGESAFGRWGFSVALNGPGSMLAAGAVRADAYRSGDTLGSVKVYLDQTPFCWVPTGNNPFHERLRCYNSADSNTPEGCVNSYSFQVGKVCEWATPETPASTQVSQSGPEGLEAQTNTDSMVDACACERGSGKCLKQALNSTDYDLCISFDEGAAFRDIQDLSLSVGQETHSTAIIEEGLILKSDTSMNCNNEGACRVQIRMESSLLNTIDGQESSTVSVTISVSYPKHRQHRRLHKKPGQYAAQPKREVFTILL